MSLPDTYHTIVHHAEFELRERASRFIALAAPMQDEGEMREWVKQLKKEHHAAAHVCWAVVWGYAGESERSSDDREPSGSAGKPILKAILAAGCTYTGIAVVRYFGGKLLGVPGLIDAYGSSAKGSLEAAGVVEKKIIERHMVPCDYEVQHEVIRICKKNQLKFYPDHQAGENGITFEVRPSAASTVLQELHESRFDHTLPLGVFTI